MSACEHTDLPTRIPCDPCIDHRFGVALECFLEMLTAGEAQLAAITEHTALIMTALQAIDRLTERVLAMEQHLVRQHLEAAP